MYFYSNEDPWSIRNRWKVVNLIQIMHMHLWFNGRISQNNFYYDSNKNKAFLDFDVLIKNVYSLILSALSLIHLSSVLCFSLHTSYLTSPTTWHNYEPSYIGGREYVNQNYNVISFLKNNKETVLFLLFLCIL